MRLSKNDNDRSITVFCKCKDKRSEIVLAQKIMNIVIKYDLYIQSNISDFPNERYFCLTGRSERKIKSAYEELKALRDI